MHDFMQSLQMRCPVAGDHRIVDADDRERGERPAFRAQLVEFGDLLLERAAGERHAERALLERIVGGAVGRLLLEQPVRAGVLALLVAPDAVVRLVERRRRGPCRGRSARSRRAAAHGRPAIFHAIDAVAVRELDRHEVHVVELARRAEQHAALVCARAPSGVCDAHAA